MFVEYVKPFGEYNYIRLNILVICFFKYCLFNCVLIDLNSKILFTYINLQILMNATQIHAKMEDLAQIMSTGILVAVKPDILVRVVKQVW